LDEETFETSSSVTMQTRENMELENRTVKKRYSFWKAFECCGSMFSVLPDANMEV